MRRRSKAGEPTKAQRRKTGAHETRITPKAVRRHSSPIAGLKAKVAKLTRELKEALEQKKAASEVLQVISGSAADLQAVFGTLLETAMYLCGSNIAAIWLSDGKAFKLVASRGVSTEFEKFATENPITPGRGTIAGRTALGSKTVHVLDVLADRDFVTDYQSRGNYRSALGVPLLRQGETIGVFVLTRSDIQPYTESQIELVENFAAQAVVAIENARLLNELRKSLQQQTATADVLKVISRSTFDLQTVLDTLLESAARLCEARRGVMFRRDGDSYRPVAFYNASPEMIDFVKRHPIKPGRHTITARVALERRTIHVADLQADPEYNYVRRDIDPIRTELGVPMFRGHDLVGVIILYKLVVQPFTDKQIRLVTTFADQAVIAIENTRLFEAEQQRTGELTEALEQQTAMSDVLRAISSSPGELEPVFNAILENATRLCEAKFGILMMGEGDAFRLGAVHDAPQPFIEFMKRGPVRPNPHITFGRAVVTKRVAQTADITIEQPYLQGDPLAVAAAELGGYRTVLAVPMLKESEVKGALIFFRQEVRAFDEKQIALVQNFARQAVIAVENARLLNELRESLQQQTATADVLKVISRSTFDLQTVLDTLTEFGRSALLGR